MNSPEKPGNLTDSTDSAPKSLAMANFLVNSGWASRQFLVRMSVCHCKVARWSPTENRHVSDPKKIAAENRRDTLSFS